MAFENIFVKFVYGGSNTGTLIDFIDQLSNYYENSSRVYMLDNATSHTNPLVHGWVNFRHLKVVYTPPYSPDVVAIELLFGSLKRKLRESYLDASVVEPSYAIAQVITTLASYNRSIITGSTLQCLKNTLEIIRTLN